MFLQHLSILNYKNLAEVDTDFSPRVNCFLGDNGAGKTNLLDAVYYLAFCKSRTAGPDGTVIRHNEGFMSMKALFDREGVQEEISVGMKAGQRKVFSRGGKAYTRMADHIGFLPLVFVSPDDTVMLYGGNPERRKFVDGIISQYDRSYLEALLRYNKLLQQRNQLLDGERQEEMLYEVCEEQMDRHAAQIYTARRRFMERFVPIFHKYYAAVSEGSEEVGLLYQSHLDDGALLPQLQYNRRRDLAAGTTTKGIHKDKLELQLDGYPLQQTGSQGQTKSYLTALKLAQFELLRSASGVTPLLLLDDVFDKLDSRRVDRILQLVSGNDFGQIFLTDTNREHLDDLVSRLGGDYRIFNVAGGRIG
ncbi:MAG: DNA replication and repair protein RecF [Paludibacteraceae bacterium]|nr:DNA replication and repair protein RecF [Paludibacteraceae bacterium]